MAMKIKNVTISRMEAWRNKDRPLQGTITFEGTAVETKMILDETRCKQILDICADMFVDSAHALAHVLRQDVAELTLLPSPSPMASVPSVDDEIPF